ncbi:hypothetical protein ERC79_16385 [Rhodococcus sp. ABRD24]|uniref:hypothetical protein n=1 Tax=Rhodococcus sp. ABRD24 TaxID=2507582 RepID=UPI00103BEC01|nr:hypothetical protein [Rhodococcus sp. ABRD24]QBJ97339.1 hypothetical protein ERC79_16385 [Rhodococcus sp. ABRD24]
MLGAFVQDEKLRRCDAGPESVGPGFLQGAVPEQSIEFPVQVIQDNRCVGHHGLVGHGRVRQ